MEHDSPDARDTLAKKQDDLLEDLRISLRIPALPRATKSDETQINSLVCALLELSGCTVKVPGYEFIDQYTVSNNADLCAIILNITRTQSFGNRNAAEIRDALLTSSVFHNTTVSVASLEKWAIIAQTRLRLGYPDNYLMWTALKTKPLACSCY